MEFMEKLKNEQLEQELFDSVFIGKEKKLSSAKVQKTREINTRAFSNIIAATLSMQAIARKEASKVFITF